MADYYLGEIRPVAFNFAPKGWAFCSGQLLPVQQNQALFSLLGTTYGGNGQTTFGLPNLQGRVIVGGGSNYQLGAQLGAESVALATAQIPAHLHPVGAALNTSDNEEETNPQNLLPAVGTLTQYHGGAATGAMAGTASGTSAPAGGGQAHENRQPYLVVNYIIALQGIFPSRG